jgi:hypothetical protein
MAEPDTQKRYNRDDEQKPGAPPRTAYEPNGAEGGARNAKTLTDPASGEPLPGAPAPDRADTHQTPRRR